MRRLARFIAGLVLIALVLAAGMFIYAWRPALDPTAETAPAFDGALVATGARLAVVGNCQSCHTTPNGRPFAGGLALATPFGTIHSTNITPDRGSGIGAWSEAAFQRAMHEGVDREGRHLYPAFPYDHFTHLTRDDTRALYAFLMTREPVALPPTPNRLPFLLQFRPLIAGWKLLYFDPGPLRSVEGKNAEWERGYYLAEGLAHCGACHTPRKALGAEDQGRHFSGAPNIEGWYAYPINSSSPAPVAWDVGTLSFYLANGFAEKHGVARGPMAEVTANLRMANEDDIRAIATYVASLMSKDRHQAQPRSQAQAQAAPRSGQDGSAIYEAACRGCHESGKPQPFGGLDLRLSTAVHSDNPQNIVNMVLYGLPAPETRPGPVMPGYDGAIDADGLIALLDYVRTEFGGRDRWPDARKIVTDTLGHRTVPALYSADGVRHSLPTRISKVEP